MKPPRFLADEDFRRDIVRAARQLDRGIDILAVQDVGMSGAPDGVVLEFAFQEGRVVMSHDVTTMPTAAIARLQANAGLAGLLLVAQKSPRRPVAENLVLIANASDADEWVGIIDYLPW